LIEPLHTVLPANASGPLESQPVLAARSGASGAQQKQLSPNH